MSKGSPPIHAWLVHGTWARQAPWTLPRSRLRESLQTAFGGQVSFDVLPWTGGNREADREAAATSLIASAEKAQSKPGLKVVIAHSHGGNIAARAAQLRPDLFDAVITLNTPFVARISRDWSVVLLHLIIFVAAIGFTVSSVVHLNAALEFVLGFGAIGAVVGVFYRFRGRLDSALERAEADMLRDAMVMGRARVLCISTADDEAFGWLEFADTLINLPFLLLHRVALPVILVGMMAAHYFFQWNFSQDTLENTVASLAAAAQGVPSSDYMSQMFFGSVPPAPHFDRSVASAVIYADFPLPAVVALVLLSTVFYFSLFYAVLAAASVIGVIAIRRLVFGVAIGPNALLHSLIARLKVTLTPAYLRQAELHIVQSGESRWLRHSDPYANPLVLRGMTLWLKWLANEAK